MKNFIGKVIQICDNGDAVIELPPELLKEMGWKEGEELNVFEKDGEIIIEKIK